MKRNKEPGTRKHLDFELRISDFEFKFAIRISKFEICIPSFLVPLSSFLLMDNRYTQGK